LGGGGGFGGGEVGRMVVLVAWSVVEGVLLLGEDHIVLDVLLLAGDEDMLRRALFGDDASIDVRICCGRGMISRSQRTIR
jgi:hypothetical protein